ncbi:transposase [Thermoanaerobacterium sp. R66]|uniref:transposase n=1 Tax=Thermoanaerobacterium sp. R66 TaxID=2742479 RepID=UPI0023802C21|nr:transposase [Thermoanaerobacterium sp. R66]MDE4542136.1 transposase [Thermoanaerobacterium sp. R66]MDE4543052.1 transposase [Thermoanaerobacterium sp. R66]MDE4543080.1 transposase [Thermoanaerobacterium sp. R66]
MYIRQECLFSFDELIKFQPETKLEMVLSQLDFSNVVLSLSRPEYKRGPKGYDPLPLLYALVAMQLEKIPNIAKLVARLKSDPVFRYNCGFNVLGHVPSTSTFSRFLNLISKSDALEEDFKQLILKAKNLNIIDGTNIAIDSTKLNAFEKPKPKSKIKDDGKSPNWGKKKDTDGNDIKWFGWKLHIIADCKSELPLAIEITPASVNDSILAIPLLKKLKEFYGNTFNVKHCIMDSGYDIKENYDYIMNEFHAQPIIAYNKRGSFAPPEGLNERLHPICSMGYELVYWGKDGDYLKFRCPHVLGKVDCPHGSSWCSNSNYGYCLKINYKKNNRYFSFPIRSSDEWQEIYNLRTSIERCNSRLKDYLNTDNLRSAGIKKAKTFALLNCITLVAGTIAVNVTKSLPKVA